jgi:hypothetical protein
MQLCQLFVSEGSHPGLVSPADFRVLESNVWWMNSKGLSREQDHDNLKLWLLNINLVVFIISRLQYQNHI